MPHDHAQHTQNMGLNLFAYNENSAYIIPHATTHAVTSCMHHVAHTHRQAGCPYENMACQKLLMDTLFAPAKLFFKKINHLTF